MIDANGHKKEYEADGLGRTVAVREYTGTQTYTLYATTAYAYDPMDRLKTVTDAASNTITLVYDLLGRKTEILTPTWASGTIPTTRPAT